MDKRSELKRIIWKNIGFLFKLNLTERWNKREAVVEQNAGNCWLYSCFNNLWLNLGYKISEAEIEEIKQSMRAFGVDTEKGNEQTVAGVFICDWRNKKYPNKKIAFYSLDFFKNTRKMAELFKNGYALIYSRSANKEFQEDIKDNDVVDIVHQLKGNWHAVNCLLQEKGKSVIMEIGQRGNHYANEFTYKDVLIFGNNIKNGTLQSDFSFFDYKNE